MEILRAVTVQTVYEIAESVEQEELAYPLIIHPRFGKNIEGEEAEKFIVIMEKGSLPFLHQVIDSALAQSPTREIVVGEVDGDELEEYLQMRKPFQ